MLDATLLGEGQQAVAARNLERLELRLARLKAAHQKLKRARLDEERLRRAMSGAFFLA